MSRTATAPVDRVKLLLQVQDVGPALTIRDGFHRMAAEGALLEHPLPRLGKWSGVWAHPWNERALQRRAKRKAALAASARLRLHSAAVCLLQAAALSISRSVLCTAMKAERCTLLNPSPYHTMT